MQLLEKSWQLIKEFAKNKRLGTEMKSLDLSLSDDVRRVNPIDCTLSMTYVNNVGFRSRPMYNIPTLFTFFCFICGVLEFFAHITVLKL